MSQKVSKETITYVNACLASQVVIYAFESLKNQNSKHYKKNVKIKAEQLKIAMFQHLNDDINKLFKNEEIQAMETVRAIEKIGKSIAEGNVIALGIIDQMLQQGFDFSKYKLVEI